MTTINLMYNEIINGMKLLNNVAYRMKQAGANKEDIIELQDNYLLVRDEAICLGLDVKNFPKRINYNSVRRIETPEERESRRKSKIDEAIKKVIEAEERTRDEYLHRFQRITGEQET